MGQVGPGSQTPGSGHPAALFRNALATLATTRSGLATLLLPGLLCVPKGWLPLRINA